jgi:hypothetical protein
MSKIAVRAYTIKSSNPIQWKSSENQEPPLIHDRVLVFDTETRTDHYQNLTFGSFKIYHSGLFQHQGIFYDPLVVTEDEKRILEEYVKTQNIRLYTLEAFIEKVFYRQIYRLKSLCIGFNLPFDISRLGFKAVKSRKNYRGGFTFLTSENESNPPIMVKQSEGRKTIRFSTTRKNRKVHNFRGYFLDVQTLAEVLLQEKHPSLERVGELLNLPIQKKKVSEHGKITREYIDYNIRDVETTYEAYKRLIDELKIFQIAIPHTKISSDASLGKYALRQLGVKPLSDTQPDFPPHILGNIMSAYYGGRTECRMRKTPSKVTVLDFTSMYPTMTMLLGIWEFIIAQGVEIKTITEEVRKLVDSLNLKSLRNRDIWKSFNVLVQVQPDEDILPVRMDYKGNNSPFNVGINHLTSKEPLWYALPDVIASKLLSGKSPKIITAISFIPESKQTGLKTSRILDILIDPSKDNLIQGLVEERQRIKSLQENRQKAMKILVNSMGYGIFIELNQEDRKSEVYVYGVDEFSTKKNCYERPGNFYHPLLAVMITAGSRLFLAMAEARLQECGVYHVYMDTDSIFVPPEYAQDLIDYFQPLNPYGVDLQLLKVDHVDVWFYGISSKRYALYEYDKGKITFLKDKKERSFKLHGLGHLTNPFSSEKPDWQEEIWHDILMLHYGLITSFDIIEKYSQFYAIARLTISTSQILDRFRRLNEGREWREQIKPFGFFHVGFQVIVDRKKPVKPLSPYSTDPQTIVHEPFIDYETGEVKRGLRFFKPLSKTILQYIDHPESKYEGDNGQLRRRHIEVTDIIHIGKEANNIEKEPLKTGTVQVFKNEERERLRIINMRQCEAERDGIARVTRWRMKKCNLN